ncbi:MAG: S41 family peptidase [Prevotellaceae bacterium]|jgi:hypothetical protein|nr:S41 family peptidase [Prevotellaceae bacterium]
MLKYLHFFCSLLIINVINAQPPELSKQQMYDDFDFLFEKVQKVSPHMAIRKQITGIDILSNIYKLRESIDTINSNILFTDMLHRALYLAMEPHNDFTDIYPYHDRDSSFIGQVLDYYYYYFQYYKYGHYRVLPLVYFNGDYYLPQLYHSDEKNIKIPARSKLLKVNGIPIEEYNRQWSMPLYTESRWDFIYKKLFTTAIFPPYVAGLGDDFLLTYEHNGVIREIEAFPYYIKSAPSTKFSPKVHYLQKDDILYIRVPEMDASQIEFYKSEILKYKGKLIKKVVIDVRANEGGNDAVWEQILAVIIDKPVEATQKLCFKDNNLVRECLERDRIVYTKEIPLIIGNDTLFCIEDTRNIAPAEKSLSYEGNIYVLTDRDCYSSTLAFIAFCENFDNLITVGTPTGYLGGEGIRPFYFILPNTMHIFITSCSLDGNIKTDNIEDYYHDKVKIPVYPDIDYYYIETEYEGDFYNEEYLYNHDPVFKKVLELE